MNIFNGYDDGYANGLRDAQNGRSKRYTGFSKLNAFFTDNAYYDTYVQGYDDGYRDGTAKKNEIYKG
ncbi:MAG: hypothetical protein WCL18_02130 [bacterium]